MFVISSDVPPVATQRSISKLLTGLSSDWTARRIVLIWSKYWAVVTQLHEKKVSITPLWDEFFCRWNQQQQNLDLTLSWSMLTFLWCMCFVTSSVDPQNGLSDDIPRLLNEFWFLVIEYIFKNNKILQEIRVQRCKLRFFCYIWCTS